MCVGEIVDKRVQRVAALNVIVDSYVHVSSLNGTYTGRFKDLRAALMKSEYECEVNKGSGRSRKNCFSRPATLLTS